jgi:hypothetical protein
MTSMTSADEAWERVMTVVRRLTDARTASPDFDWYELLNAVRAYDGVRRQTRRPAAWEAPETFPRGQGGSSDGNKV